MINQFELEDILNESMADFGDNPTYETIMHWICRFPEVADEIFFYIDVMIWMGENE